MKTLNYYTLDVFTADRYKGNPLAVVWSDEVLKTETYYAITREFGYSETSFVAYSRSEKAFKVRSFTPGHYEMTGAGHNLLGAVSLALIKEWDIFSEQGERQWVMMKDQEIPLSINYSNGLHFVGMKQREARALGTVDATAVAGALRLPENAIYLNGWQPTIMETEVAHLMVPIRNNQSLNLATPDNAKLTAIAKAHGFEGFYLFSLETSLLNYIAETRFFNPAFGINEDPATGTAAGPLAAFLAHKRYLKLNESYNFLQGTLTGHQSTLQVRVVNDGVWVSGSSVLVMEGKLLV